MRKFTYAWFLLIGALGLHAMESNERKLCAAFYAKNPEIIKYCKGIPASGLPVEEIPLEQFCEDNQFTWTNALVLDLQAREQIWVDRKYPKTAITAIEDRLHNPLSDLVICDMGPVGKGLFLSLDADPLPTGTVICIYAGELCSALTNTDNVYTMSACENEHESSVAKEKIAFPCVCGRNFGNFARFCQDLPNPENDLANVKCLDLNKSNIATENCCVMAAVHKGFPISYVATVREISPGEQLGWPYEKNYWRRKNIKRVVFDKEGNIIGRYIDQEQIEFDESFVATKDKQAPRVDLKKEGPILVPLLKGLDIDNFNHREGFIYDVLCCLDAYDDGSSDFIRELRSKFIEAKTTNEKFKTLNVVYPKELGEMRRELIFHMNNYNAGQRKIIKK